jgi:hypothetical protein
MKGFSIFSAIFERKEKQFKFDHINQMITLSLITLSGFYCTYFLTLPYLS